MSDPMTRDDRLIAYAVEIDELNRQVADLTAGKMEIRMRGPDGAYASMNVEAEVNHLKKRVAIMQDALSQASMSHRDNGELRLRKPTLAEGDGKLFYRSENGDAWLLVTDGGGRRFVRHVPNTSSGGTVELIDLETFRLQAPHSPQNQALENWIR